MVDDVENLGLVRDRRGCNEFPETFPVLRFEGRGDEIVAETVEVADIGLESLGSALGQSGVVVIRAFRRGETLD